MRELKIGVEIELFGVNYQVLINELRDGGISVASYTGYTHQVIPQWKVTTDASVTSKGTGLGNGLELVSPILYGEEGLNQLNKVCEILNRIGAKVDRTCGLHVHFDIADYTVENVKSLLCYWLQNKSLINGILPKSRRRNSYCTNINSSDLELMEVHHANSISDIANLLGSRYRVINLRSYARYGTIEFRQHSGTIEYEKIEHWIIMLYQMLVYAKNNTVTLEATGRRNSPANMKQFIKELDLNDTYTEDYLLARQMHFKIGGAVAC